MKLHYLEKPRVAPAISYVFGSKRFFELAETVEIELSDNYWLKIEKGFRTDLRSVPKWLWSILPPYDDAFIAFLIHDALWSPKEKVRLIAKFNGDIEKAKKFTEYEMLKWSNAHAPNLKRQHKLIHKFLRSPFVMKYYTKQIKIPE